MSSEAPKVAAIYYSSTGTVHKIAQARGGDDA
jgi:hypothetical protein